MEQLYAFCQEHDVRGILRLLFRHDGLVDIFNGFPGAVHVRAGAQKRFQAFPLATLLDCAGLLCSALLWRQFQTLLSLLPGLLLQLLALTIALSLRGFSRVPNCTQHWRRWLRHNLWVLLPIPILWGSSLLFSMLPFSYWGPAPFIAALICYLVVVPLSVRQLH